ILMTLQPWFKGGELRFLSNLTCMDDIIMEFNTFPRGTDDILDTLADQFQNRAWFGRLKPRREDTIGVTAHLTNKEIQTLTQRWLKISPDMPKRDSRLVVHEPGLPAGL
ncbi:unnamed protein product, partial [marine sediment metagenome]